MRFNIERNYLILGIVAIVCGMIVAYFEPVGGALMAALGGIGMQLHLDSEPVVPVVPVVPEKKPEPKSQKKIAPKP